MESHSHQSPLPSHPTQNSSRTERNSSQLDNVVIATLSKLINDRSGTLGKMVSENSKKIDDNSLKIEGLNKTVDFACNKIKDTQKKVEAIHTHLKEEEEMLNHLREANTTFSLALLRKLSEDNKTANIFFSPFSISSALAMVMLGARGNTATQISECLKIQDCQDDVHTQFAKLLREHKKLKEPGAPLSLIVANRLYGEQAYRFLQGFLTQTRTHYNSELESVDFRTSWVEARVKINSWVEEQTQGKIKDIVAEGAVDNMTRMVLVNTIYFKNTWNGTLWIVRPHEFRINKILEMPFRGKELSMLIFLPEEKEDNKNGLEKVGLSQAHRLVKKTD
ncbi:leukocyte elastase inhibitor-like [Fundulus diaphanus]